MKTISLLCLMLALFSCKTSKQISDNSDDNQSATTVKLNAQLRDSKQDISDQVSILEHRIEGNILFLKVSYSGGCKEHEFLLIGSPNIAKSLPPIRSVRLIHHGNQDACKKLIEQTMEIDITPLAYKKEAGSVIYLELEGIKERITYEYKEPK